MKKVILTAFLFIAGLNNYSQIGGLLDKAKKSTKESKQDNKIDESKNNDNSTKELSAEEESMKRRSENKKKEDEEKASEIDENFKNSMVKDDGITSPIHKSNVGKIVFSKNHIEEGKENATLFANNFSSSDPIYARFYLPQSLFNTPIYSKGKTEWRSPSEDNFKGHDYESTFIVELWINGKRLDEVPQLVGSPVENRRAFIEFTGKKEENENIVCSLPYGDFESAVAERNKKTTAELFINTTQQERFDKKGSDWAVVINSLPPGDYNIKLVVWPWRFNTYTSCEAANESICEGEFKFSKKAGDFIPYGVDFKSMNKKSYMSNPTLEAQIKIIIENYGEKPSQKVKVIKLGINEDDWTIHKNIKGVMEYKAISIWCVVKDANGFCKMAYESILEEYNQGAWSKPYGKEGRLMFGAGGVEYIDCQTVK